MANYYVLLTDYGKSFIANAQASTQLALTHVVLGDANDQPYLPESRLDKTALLHQRAKLPVASVNVISETTAEVTVIVPSNVGGFNVHEIGIADSSGKLVYVGNFHGGYRPTLTEGAGGDMELIITIKADNLATIVIDVDSSVVNASREWVNERFVTKIEFQEHLDDINPHDQYVLEDVYDQYVIQNNIEHQGFTDWQQQHLLAQNPHNQYVLKTTYDNKIDELISRINLLADAIGEDVIEGDYSVALLALRVQHKIFQGEGFNRTQVTKTQESGLPFAGYPASISVTQGIEYSRNYDFAVTLPESYDPDIHRINAFGGNAHRIEGNKVIFVLSTQVESYTYNPGGDSVEETGYRSSIDATVQIEMFSSVPPPPTSGALVALLDINLSDTARSANDVSSNGRVTLNNESGFPFGYPAVVNLEKPTTNTPLDYQLITKVLLPVEYQSADHDLVITNSSGTYTINQADRSVDFSSTVTSVLQADNEVLDTLNATFHLEVRNK